MCSSTASRRSRASSGSRPLSSSSDCRRSANRTVTTFRSPPRAVDLGRSGSSRGGAGGASDDSPAESGPLLTPHPPQKPSFTSLRWPHDGQTRLKERPHVPQKRWLAWFWARHRGHSIAGRCAPGDRSRLRRAYRRPHLRSRRYSVLTVLRSRTRSVSDGQLSELPGCCLRRKSWRSFISLSESSSPLGSSCRSSLAVASYSCSS